MLSHKGVLKWYDTLPLDRPNRFLGITEANRVGFASLSRVQQCAWRWVAHRDELDRLCGALPERVHLVGYEDFAARPGAELQRLAQFLRVENDFVVPSITVESLDKWKHQLTELQVRQVGAVAQAEADDTEASWDA